MALYQRHPSRPLDRPVLVTALEGFVDAGLGAATAVASLLSRGSERVATFDSDELIDYRVRRPTLHVADGVTRRLEWQSVQLRAVQDREGRDVVALVGPEPDLRWHAFVRAVVELARELDVRLAVGLGAFPAPAPHTRPVRLAATATDEALARQVGYVSGTIAVPASVEGALEPALAEAGIPAVGLWARVPHYVAAMPYPAASAALVDGLAAVAGLSFDAAALHAAADAARQRVDALIAQSEEHQRMVRELEARIDATEGNPLDLGQVPSGDEIAAELERYLREEGGRA
jgi:hypothetical protein